ncbi:hypothetical protein Q9L58_008278 [Maublancomyces gigas]|uniref:S-adenosyl-L-methionine-dependent methyltransferase n=1 Tax=Discina gigas TaxID=1032678 RepID=A0ABR3GA84_9PEZI
MMDDKLHLAPIDSNPQNILDIGTGTGIWAMDVGERYPSAQVIGTDLSPIQPSWVPPNVRFEIDDAESEWTFKKNFFDLVHIRNLGGAIKDWEKLLTEAYKHCRPGGWVDIAEYEMVCFSDDGSVQESMTLSKFYVLINQAVEKSGRGFHMAKLLGPVLTKIGFTNVHHEIAKGPLGPWAANKKEKEIGAYMLLSAETGFEATGIGLFTNVLGMDPKEAQRIIAETLKQAKSRKIHAYGKQ